jgi:nucleoside 2-deoxyribosyltransferase
LSDRLENFAAEHPGATVYLAGPMSGLPEYNFPAFRAGARELRDDYRLTVLSPVEMDEAEGFDASHADAHIVPGDADWSTFLARDVKVVADADVRAVVVLDGWENSQGAALETQVAQRLGKPVYELATGRQVKYLSDVRPTSQENIAEEAVRLVQPGGDRHEQYGAPLEDFTRSAIIMSVILGHEVKPEQVPLLMIAVKLSRLVQTPQKRDSAVDVIGYALTYEDAMNDLDRPLK